MINAKSYHTGVDATIYNLSKLFSNNDEKSIIVDEGNPFVEIDYNISIEHKEYGIKAIDTSVNWVRGEIKWEWEGKSNPEIEAKLIAAGGKVVENDDDESRFIMIKGTIEIDSTEQFNGKDWDVSVDLDISHYGFISPSACEIDFGAMTITIS